MEANELPEHNHPPNQDDFKPINFLESLASGINADYFGATCLDCEKVVAGKGFNATAETCIHKYEYEYDTLICTYCGHPKKPTLGTRDEA
jgi:hypothetical protein